MFDNKILITALLLFEIFNVLAKLQFATSNKTGAFYVAQDLTFCSTYCFRNAYDLPDLREEQHVNCKCYQRDTLNKECHLFDMDFKLFRWVMTEYHNDIRNLVAQGVYRDEYLPEASDMNAISYDVGLAYTAMCTAKRCAKSSDACLILKHFPFVTQNQYTATYFEDIQPKELAYDAVNYWIHTRKLIQDSEILHKYVPGPWEPAITIIQSQIIAFGCGVTHNSKSIFVICNYGSEVEINQPKDHVYRIGKACTQCTKNRCSSSHSALCGEILPIPIVNIPKSTMAIIQTASAWGLFATPLTLAGVRCTMLMSLMILVH